MDFTYLNKPSANDAYGDSFHNILSFLDVYYGVTKSLCTSRIEKNNFHLEPITAKRLCRSI